MAPQSRGGNTSTGAPLQARKFQSYSLSSPNLRTLSSSLDPSVSVHLHRNGDFVGDDDDLDDDGEDDDDGDGDMDDADFQRHYSLDGGEESGSEGEDDDENGEGENEEDGGGMRRERQHHRPTFRRSASDHLPQTLQHNNTFPTTNNPNHHFAPPFYGRPPTPLPPSPSLTSLLRPPFSSSRLTTSPSRPTTSPSGRATSPSRPTTSSSRLTASPSRPTASSSRLTSPADSSDEDTEARAEEVPRVSPKVPTYEYYGLLNPESVIYLLWSYLPSPFLHALGIYYYPNRWWSLAIPSFLVMSLVYIYVALAAYNTEYLTLPIESIESIVDEVANIAVLGGGSSGSSGGAGDGKGKRRKGKRGEGRWGGGREEGKREWRGFWGRGTDAVLDVPVGGVCEVLYGEGREWVDDEGDEGEEEEAVAGAQSLKGLLRGL